MAEINPFEISSLTNTVSYKYTDVVQFLHLSKQKFKNTDRLSLLHNLAYGVIIGNPFLLVCLSL